MRQVQLLEDTRPAVVVFLELYAAMARHGGVRGIASPKASVALDFMEIAVGKLSGL